MDKKSLIPSALVKLIPLPYTLIPFTLYLLPFQGADVQLPVAAQKKFLEGFSLINPSCLFFLQIKLQSPERRLSKLQSPERKISVVDAPNLKELNVPLKPEANIELPPVDASKTVADRPPVAEATKPPPDSGKPPPARKISRFLVSPVVPAAAPIENASASESPRKTVPGAEPSVSDAMPPATDSVSTAPICPDAATTNPPSLVPTLPTSSVQPTQETALPTSSVSPPSPGVTSTVATPVLPLVSEASVHTAPLAGDVTPTPSSVVEATEEKPVVRRSSNVQQPEVRARSTFENFLSSYLTELSYI